MRKILIIFLLLFFVIQGEVISQPLKQFSKGSEAFLKELTEMFLAVSSVEQKEKGKLIMTEFSELWNTNKLGQDQKDSIYAMCNIMLKRKMKTFPNYEQFLLAEINFHKSKLDEQSYDKWHISLRKLAAMTNSIRFMALLESTNLLLSNNQLYNSQLTIWKTKSMDFVFNSDSLPYFEFPSLDLICVKKNDSTCIYNTSGKFYPTANKWVGQNGNVYWDRAGFGWEEVKAEIKKSYNIQLSKSEFTVDTVTFYNTNFFQKPLYGKLEEKVMADVGEDRISYPRFTSFDNRLEIKNIFQDIDYSGGFAMQGPKLVGKGDKEDNAYLFFKKDNTCFVKLGSKAFIIRKDMIGSELASIVIYVEKDSITHPGLKMKYTHENRELSLIREKDGISKSPYFNTYHKIDMYFESLYWKLEQPKIDFGFIKGSTSESNALFESDNYYSAFRWEKLRGLDELHPLMVLKKLADETGSKTLYLNDIIYKFKVSKEQVQAMLLTYAEKGFIIYDYDDGIVVLKDRVYNYINSKSGKTDYDVMQFNSIISAQNNATLNLLNYDLRIRGVARVFLSDSQNVYVDPYEQELTLKKNRNFEFDGKIHAGLFDFYGKKFLFNYDKFKFDMELIDSMSFKVQDRSQPTDIYGHHPLVKVRTVIENLHGEMLIDHPNNKSGLKSFPGYPSFVSKKDAYVYYDKPFIYKKVYSREKFYFRLQPFKIDSLDSYDSERKQFGGYLVSAGIFPDINEPLKVQPDYSLGFVIKTPPDGFPAYGGKGRYDSIVDLSYKGFLGKGTIKYQTSIARSNDIVFFPDSLWAIAYQYTVQEKTTPVEYPKIYAEDVVVKWYPYMDEMRIIQKSKPFDLFASKAILTGGLKVTSKGAFASGKMIFGKVEMVSDKYSLKHHQFDSDTTMVKFKTSDLNDVVLQTDNFKVNIDFNKQLGKFKSNDQDSKIAFPFNNYACYLYDFDWYMNKDLIELHSSLKSELSYLKSKSMKELIDEDLSKSQFISEHPAQASLSFYAPDASYNLNDNIINAVDVPLILVADAAIYPDSGKVTILRKAEMLTLKNSKIIANTQSQNHLIYNSTLDIISKKKYSGTGYYNYIDELDQQQKIYLNTITVDNAGNTTGSGDIDEKADFTLSPFFYFQGKTTLRADKDSLFFDGGVKIKHNCDTLKRKWLKFATDIDPKNIAIPVSDKPREYLKGAGGENLGMGLYIGDDSTLVYPAFIQYKNRHSDSEVIAASGFLTYDKVAQRYYVGPVIDSSAKYPLAQNYVYIDAKECKLFGEGKIDLGTNLGRIQLESYGTAENDMNTGTTDFDIAMFIDFFFDKDAYDFFTKQIQQNAGLEAADPSSDKFFNALRFVIGGKKADDLLSQISLSGKIKNLPDELKRTLIISDIKFGWNPKSRSFVSDGKIGIAIANEQQLNKYVNGYIEINRKRSGSIVNMYFEIGDDWFYFNYQLNKLQSISNKKEYNDFIKKAMESNKNILKAEDNKPQFAFIIATEKRKNDFLKKIGKSGEEFNESND